MKQSCNPRQWPFPGNYLFDFIQKVRNWEMRSSDGQFVWPFDRELGENIDSRFNWMIHLCHVFVQEKEPGLVCPVQTSNTQCFSLWRAYIKQFHRGIERSAQSSIEVIDQFHYIWYKMTIVFLHVMTFNFRSHQDGSNQGKKKKLHLDFHSLYCNFFPSSLAAIHLYSQVPYSKYFGLWRLTSLFCKFQFCRQLPDNG